MGIIKIEKYCPFLMCLKPVPHDHQVCEECGAVRYGNVSCLRCQVMRDLLGDDA